MKARTIAGALAAAGVLGAAIPHWSASAGLARAATPQAVEAPDGRTLARTVTPIGAPDYRSIVARYGPAVVGVTVESGAPDAEQALDFGSDPFFRFHRGLPFPQAPGNEVPVRGQGSGFIVSPDGVLLTNAHVVRNAKTVTVKLADRREFEARVLGVDPATDVAVLKIEASGLPTVSLGDPSRLAVGDYVLAIGSPYGFEQSASSGIVSATGRSLPGDSYVPFIQTDVAVNPGNSGGPLFDSQGQVIGINSQIWSRTGGYQGLSFAIPIDVAVRVRDQILATGEVRHARLGVTVQELNQALAESFGLRTPDGALVSGVTPGSAAEEAGLKAGDVILALDGQSIERSGDLAARIGMAAPGDRVRIAIVRRGERMQIDAVLGESRAESLALAGQPGTTDDGRLGLAVRPLAPAEREAAGGQGGLVVEQASGPAARAGISRGDLILSVNGEPVADAAQLREAARAAGHRIALLIQRGDTRIFVPVRTG